MTKKVKCVDNHDGENCLTINRIYEVLGESNGWYSILNDEKEVSNYRTDEFVHVDSSEAVAEETVPTAAIDAHYSFNYSLTQDDVDAGYIKVDPYFVAKQWALGSKDDTGVLFHCLKNISRYSDKNTKQREITALHLQIKRLAELEGVVLP
jgi:hypothetical protein